LAQSPVNNRWRCAIKALQFFFSKS
jgi:hypothetical protein